MEKSSWVWNENLYAFLEMLSYIVDYDFTDSDWDAIEFGIINTSYEKGIWFDYSLFGKCNIDVSIAKDNESGLVFYRLLYDERFKGQVHLIAFITNEYWLTKRNKK